MKKLFICFFVNIVTVLLPLSAYSYQQSPDPKEPTQLTLEIVFLKGQPPSLYPVASAQAKPSGGWSARFRRVAGWQPPQDALPIKAIQVVSRLEGKVVKVQVSVLSGREVIEHESSVIAFDLNDNQTRVIAELSEFGIEPIEIKVVRVFPRRAVLPQIINKTESVLVKGLTVGVSTLPSYLLSLQNIATSDVVAMEVNIVVNGKKEIILIRQGEEGQSLIPARGSYDLTVSGAYQVRPADRETPRDFSHDHDCIVLSAVFRDGSYEGDPLSASRFRATLRGQQLQLIAVVALLQEALNSTDEINTVRGRLRAEITSFKAEVNEAEVTTLLEKFPTLPASAKPILISAMRVGLDGIRSTIGKELDKFEKAQQGGISDKVALRVWLLATKEKCEQWLSKL